MSKKICSLSIRFNLVCDGLIGGTHEYRPYLAWHASFGRHRLMTIDHLQQQPSSLGIALNAAVPESKEIVMDATYPSYRETQAIEIELNDYDEMKGDDTIAFKLFVHTRDSGVDSIDKSESAYVERQISAGLCQLELYDIFNYHLRTCESKGQTHYNQPRQHFSITAQFIDQKMLDEKIRDIVGDQELAPERFAEARKRAIQLTQRATITFDVIVRDFNHELYTRSIFNVKALRETGLHAMLKLNTSRLTIASSSSNSSTSSQQPEFESLLFNSKKSWHLMMTSMSSLLDVYCKHFIPSRDTGAPLLQPSEPVIANLQLPLYNAENGKMPVYAYWSNHDPYYREYASEEMRARDLEHYGFDARSEAYFLMALRSSLRRHNLSEKRFIETIERHFSPTNTSDKVDPYFLLVEEVVADVGTFMANSAYYTADYRFVPLVQSLGIEGMRQHQHKDIGEARRCRNCQKTLKMKVVGLDSWDNVILNGTSMCDDCEGQDNTATTIIRSLAIGRVDLNFGWEAEALKAAQKLLSHSVIYDVGALVTSAFVDTNNKKIEARQEELPLIGSELDKNAQNDGHCFAVMQSLTRTIRMLEKGNTKAEVLKKMRAANMIGGNEEAFIKRDGARKTLVLEPTGSIEPRILSLAESYGKEACDDANEHLFAKKKAELCFMKHMRLRLKERKEDSGIAELFVGEGLPHYVDRQIPQRRVSDFYNSVVHGSSIDLYRRFDVTLSQVAFAKRVNNETCYGVRIGELIRDDERESHLSLICPYRDYKQRWLNEIVPLVETVQNQMPLMKFGRYDESEYKNDIYSRCVSMNALETEDKETQREFERLAATSDALDSNHTIVRLYSRLWKLNKDSETTKRFDAFLRDMPGLVKYACYVERHIPVCEPIVEILCLIDVQKSLTLPTTTNK